MDRHSGCLGWRARAGLGPPLTHFPYLGVPLPERPPAVCMVGPHMWDIQSPFADARSGPASWGLQSREDSGLGGLLH